MQQLTTPTQNSKTITFQVLGSPVPQGSVRAFGSRVIANNHQVLGSWRSDVAAAAERHKPEGWDITAPVALGCEFVFPRLYPITAQAKTQRSSSLSAPLHHVKAPDLDKLTRAIGDSIVDAVAQILLKNDSQIVSIYANKRYANDDFLGAIITVTALS